MNSVLTKEQKRTIRADVFEEQRPVIIDVVMRHDDHCGNGHNTFSITGRRYDSLGPVPGEACLNHAAGVRLWLTSAGAIHKDIAMHFPGLAPLLKWHLCSTDGPMHYLANTIYLAGDRDHYGKRAGEPLHYETAVKFGDFPILWRASTSGSFVEWLKTNPDPASMEVVAVPHPDDCTTFTANYTFSGAPNKWHECPFRSVIEATEFLQAAKLHGYEVISTPCSFSQGKARELNAARRSAIWPEATDEELCAPPDVLRARLLERLPALMQKFKAAVESLGFVY